MENGILPPHLYPQFATDTHVSSPTLNGAVNANSANPLPLRILLDNGLGKFQQ